MGTYRKYDMPNGVTLPAGHIQLEIRSGPTTRTYGQNGDRGATGNGSDAAIYAHCTKRCIFLAPLLPA